MCDSETASETIARLKALTVQLNGLAWSMPAPNAWVPQFLTIALELERALADLAGTEGAAS